MTNRWFRASGRMIASGALLVLAAGCASKRDESVEEGIKAAQHAALAQAASGGSATTPAPIPSLEAGEGSVQVPLSAPPATAPPPDKSDNDNPDHLLARCRDRAARHETFDAIGDCRRSYELRPSSIEPQVELMHLLIDLQSYGDAEESAKKVLAVRPNDPVALYYLAWSYRGREKFPQAIATLKKVVAADPKRVEYVQALAVTYRVSGNYGKSLETLDQALKMQPSNAKTQSMIAQTRTELAEKLSPYRRLVKEKADSYDNQAALGFIYQKFGISDKALQTYDTALSMMPAPIEKQNAETKKLAAQIYYNRGVVYRDLGKPEVAEPALSQAMQLDPSLASFAWYYIGLCRYDAGKYDASIDALRKSVELAPDVADNRQALADSYDKAGKADLAAEQRNAVAAITARGDAAKEQFRKEEADAAADAEKKSAGAAATTVPETESDASPPAASAGSAPAAAASQPSAPSRPEPSLDPGVDDGGH